MGRQSTTWMQSEGNAWHDRNVAKLGGRPDPVIDTILELNLFPETVFEVGCGNGWRLAQLRDRVGCKAWGCDLSTAAIADGMRRYRKDSWDDTFNIGWREAKNMRGIPTHGFDMVIYGFCLYQVDPEDLFQIVKEGDRILKDGGHLIVYDFLPDAPHSRNYGHVKELKTYKMNHAQLWLAHPYYSLKHSNHYPHEEGEMITSDTRVGVTVLHKNIQRAFPLHD